MKRKSKIVFSLMLAVLFLGSGLGSYFYYFPLNLSYHEPLRLFWLPSGQTEIGLSLIERYCTQIDLISPTWYCVLPNGTLLNYVAFNPETLSDIQDIVFTCHYYNITVHPLISAVNATGIRILLENSTRQQEFFDTLLSEQIQYGFDGINIDLEGVPEDLREEFNSFFIDLKTSLPPNCTLSIDVPAKATDHTTGWGGWCDYSTLGGVTDYLMIMTYDLHGGWSEPGEIASTSWVRAVLNFAMHEVPHEKILIGIPWYGYDWSEDPSWENWGFGYDYFANLISTYGGSTTRTFDGRELRYKYTDTQGYTHITYFCDAETTRSKEHFLAHFPVGGLCYWHLTCGDPTYWIE